MHLVGRVRYDLAARSGSNGRSEDPAVEGTGAAEAELFQGFMYDVR